MSVVKKAEAGKPGGKKSSARDKDVVRVYITRLMHY